MLRLIERSIAELPERLVLLAPPGAYVPEVLSNVTFDAGRRSDLVRQIQAMRGAVYVEEGNVRPEDLSAGLHKTPEDSKSWHLLFLGDQGEVSSCGWYLVHPDARSIQDLRLRNCPLLKRRDTRHKLVGAIESELKRAREAGFKYAELGGWAVTKGRRGTPDGLMLALAGYALSRILGGALGMTLANVAHGSASILERLGGSPFEYEGAPIDAYFDMRFNTRIELLRFDSRQPSPRFEPLIEALRQRLAVVPVIADDIITAHPSTQWRETRHGAAA